MLKKHNFAMKMCALLLCTAVAIACFYVPEDTSVSAEYDELRGLWVSTVANIDYPSTQTTNADTLQSELLTIIENADAMGFNSIFFQVRPASDAFYQSDIFPWSRYLTGTQGTAPENGFDPLAFAIEETHKRGMELHAWINPYRITNTASDNDKLAANNPAVLHPELVITDSNGKMYYNPGEADAIDLIIAGAVEIVQKYDVDGIHMDDYFYPTASFNDDGTYAYYQDQYPDKADWRRSMVDTLVREMGAAVHEVKPDVQFGISPSGIWANDDTPGGSATRGSSSYHQLYADTKGWVEKGYLDYIMPQIYWNIGYEIADYSILSQWWSDVVTNANNGTKLYIGEAAYKASEGSTDAWKGDNGINELRTHVQMCRENSNISGYCMFTYGDFIDTPALYQLMQEVNATPANKIESEEPPAEATAEPEPTQAPENTEDSSDKPSVPAEGGNEGIIDEGTSSIDGYVNKFQDLDEYWWAIDSINALASQGIIKGRSETEFDPDSYITRADNTILLFRVLGKTATFTDNFDDVYPGTYYYDEIGMAKALGIATGVGNNLFDPEQKIQRQDMATMAYRVLSQEKLLTAIPNTAILNQFSDKNDMYFYAQQPIAACVEAGLMSGYGDGTIRPREYATRLEVALFVHRIQLLMQSQQTTSAEA